MTRSGQIIQAFFFSYSLFVSLSSEYWSRYFRKKVVEFDYKTVTPSLSGLQIHILFALLFVIFFYVFCTFQYLSNFMQHTVFIWYLVRWALFTGAILKEEVTLKRHQTKRKKQRRFYLTNDKLKKVLIQYLNTRKKIEGDLDLNAPLITNQMSGKFSSASPTMFQKNV